MRKKVDFLEIRSRRICHLIAPLSASDGLKRRWSFGVEHVACPETGIYPNDSLCAIKIPITIRTALEEGARNRTGQWENQRRKACRGGPINYRTTAIALRRPAKISPWYVSFQRYLICGASYVGVVNHQYSPTLRVYVSMSVDFLIVTYT